VETLGSLEKGVKQYKGALSARISCSKSTSFFRDPRKNLAFLGFCCCIMRAAVGMTCTARWGLKQFLKLLSIVAQLGRNDLYSPLGIETHRNRDRRCILYAVGMTQAALLGLKRISISTVEMDYTCRNDSSSPFGIDGTKRYPLENLVGFLF
jgi:hypothetical protein